MTPVPPKTDLTQTTEVLEDSRESSVKWGFGERISLAEEVGHRQERVKTYETEVPIRESLMGEESTLKREIRQQMVLAEDEVSTWYSGGQQVEHTQPDVEPAYTEYEPEKLEDTEAHDEEDFPGDKAVDRKEEMSFRLVSPPLKKADLLPSERDVSHPPEMTRPTKKEVPPSDTEFTSQKELLTYKKTPQEKKLVIADIPSTYNERKDVFESLVLVHRKEIDEETGPPMEDFVKPKISASKEIAASKKPRVLKEVTFFKKADSVEVEEVPAERAIPLTSEEDLPQILSKTTLSHPMTTLTPKKEEIIPTNMESSREEITKTPTDVGKMYLKDIVPLEKPTPVSAEVSFEEQLVQTRSIPASKEVSLPVPARIPSPEKTVLLGEGISPPKDAVLPTEKTSPKLPKAVVAPEEVTLPKKPMTKTKVAPTSKSQVPPHKKPFVREEETLPSKKPASLAERIITPKVDSSEDATTTVTKPPPTREDDKKAEKGTQEIEQQTLQKVPPLKQKGKIPVQEAKTPESPKLKSKFPRVTKEKEPEVEVVKLKKVPVKPPEPDKQVVTHKAEVTRHQDQELTVHGLRDREDREVITLGRTERVFTAEEETAQLGYFEKAEKIAVVQKTEKEGWTRTPKPQKEEEPDVPNVDKKKITKLTKADEQKDSVKLKPFEKSGKPEEESQKIQLKKVPTKPKEPEKEVITHKVEVTRHYDTEAMVGKLHDREDREVRPHGRTEQVFTAAEKASELGQMEEPKKLEAEDEKSRWLRTPKAPKDEEPEPDLTKKKIKKLPKKDEEQEQVILKPFDKVAKPEEKPDKAFEEEKPEPVDTKVPSRTPRVETPREPTEQQLRKVEKTATPKKEDEKPQKKEEPAVSPKKPSPPGKKEPEKEIPQKQTDILKKGIELKKTSSPRLGKDKVDEEKPLKPIEQLKKVELKKTPSPKVDKQKPKELEQIPVEKKPSAERIPKTVSPKDSIEAVTLKKVPKKLASPDEASQLAKPDKVRIPVVREVSPGAVQMKKVLTQQEEEVFEEEAEENEGEDEEEVWGWELVPSDDWEGEGVDGALETPGTPGAKRDGKPTEEAPKGRGRGLGARQTPSPGDAGKGRGLRPGGKGPSPPEEPFGGFKLKAVPLKFVKKIQDIVLKEAESIGSSAVFECEISPSTAITTWMKDGSNLREGPKHKFTADGKDRKLNIIDVQLSDTGEYTCVGKNAGKEITCTAKLVVEELPVKWLKELEPETSCIKTQPMYLTCELNKERDVVWKRNGALLKKKAGKVAINIIGMQHAVTIQNATEEDAGAYTCEVAGQEDVKTTTNVKVIEIIKDWLTKPLRDQHVKPKAKATFKCELFKDTPNWKWFKGDNELAPSDKVEINKDGKDVTLTIKNCQPDDVSDYTIEVEDRRYTAKLTLGEREAEILKPLSSVEVVEKEEANFNTEISEEDVVGEWKLRGQVLMRSPTCDIKSEGGKRFLTLKHVQLDQAGEVSYQALNAVTSAMLSVKEIEMGFVEPLRDVSVPEKKQAKFECTITKEVSKVMWFRGVEIVTPSPKYEIMDDGKKHMLIINSCEFDDEAQYTIEVLGQRSSAQLAVEGMRLKFVQQLQDQTVKEGKTVRFELELSHDNVPVVWYRNEMKLHVSRTVLTHVEGKKHILEMRTLTLDDTCLVKAEAKGIYSMAKLTVIEGDAVFVTKLQDYTATEKDEVSLDCELSKDVPVVWYYGEKEVIASKTVVMRSEATRRSLVLKKVTQSDKGKYTCDCGTDKTSASLIIEARDIKVVRPIYGVELFDGETARFEVEISEDDVHGQWKLNGEVLSPSSDVDIIEEGGKHTLILYNCKVSMTGEVAYAAANAKCSANLKVKELPLNFLTQLNDVQVYEKDEARFEVELSRVPKSFRWLKGSQELQKDDKYEMIQDGNMFVLVIRLAAYDDEAKYMFEAEDKRTAGKLVIQGIRLEFAKPIKDVTVKERETAEFSVELSHDKISVVWYKNDVRLHPSKVVHMADHGKVHTLAFKEVTIDDTSMIKVEAMDKTMTAMLTVIEGDLYFTTKLQNYTAVERDEVKLVCELSKSVADVKWFKDGKEITPSKNIAISTDGKKRILMVRKAEKANIGEYTCDCGSDKTTARLNIEERDIKVVRPLYSVEVTETETAKFETEISEEDVHGNWKLKGEALLPCPDVEIKEEGTKHLLILYNVRMDMAGSVDFSAANAKSNAQLRVKARSIGLMRPLKDVTVTAGETATFECELSYEGIAVDWFLGGKKMEASERVKTRVVGRVHTLTIRDVKLSEAGEVKLSAKDFQTQAQLIIRQPPVEFTKPLEDQTVEEEASVTLECEVSRENAEVRWFREGQEVRKTKKYDLIVDGVKRKLVIHGCLPDDAKMYTCDASEFKTSCFLEVTPPHVEFSKPLQDVEVKEKESAKFECEVSRESAKVRWFKDGNEIRKGKKYEIVAKGKQRILIVHKSVFDDEAEYECDARTAKSSGMLTVIEEAARFTKNLSNVEGMETDSVKMICEVSKPVAEVTWYRGDEELPEGGRYEQISDGRRRILIIQDLRMEDAGEYNCRLSPTAKTSATLRLHELAAEFIARPQNQEAVEGEKAEFVCSVSKETYEVKWFRGETEVHPGEKYSVVSEGKRRALIVKSCELKDEGGYVAQIGSVKASAELYVIEKLRIITPIKDAEVKEGSEIVFNCETNTEGAKAKWLKNEETIFESSKYMMAQRDNVFSLRIRDAQKADEAVYTISLTNQRAEHAKSTASAKVAEEKLRFLRPIEDIETQEKKTIGFVCEVNRPEATVRWLKAGQEVTLSKRLVYRADGLRHTLTIKDCVMDDEGEYTAAVGDDKCAAELIISEAPTDFTAALKDTTVTEFEDAEFVCKLSKEKAMAVKWYRNGREIREGARYHMEKEGKTCRLVIKVCRPDDECEYACGVEERRTRARLFVEETPVEIVRPPQDAFEPPGSDVVFEAELNKDRVEVRWMRNNMIIVQGDKYQMISEGKTHRLQVCEIRPRDQGEYRIVAKDKDARAKLELAAVPKIRTTDQNLVTDAGKPFVMSVPYDAYPRADAEWMYEGAALPVQNIDTSADRTEYRLKSPRKEDQGRYRVVVRNKHGQGEAFINLDVIDVPGPVKNLRVVDTADGEVSLAWEEPETDGGSKIVSYVVERRDVKRKTWTLATNRADAPEYCVSGLQKENKYLFRVCAQNRVGSGPTVATDDAVQAKNKFDVPDAPENVAVGVVNRFGATVSWEPPKHDGGSEITAYVIELRDRTAVKWEAAMVCGAKDRTATLSDVVENKEYIFRVRAENKAGIGRPSAATKPVKIMDPIEGEESEPVGVHFPHTMLANDFTPHQVLHTHSGIEISHEYEPVRERGFLQDGIKSSVEILFDVVLGIKSWSVCTNESGKASLCQGDAPCHQSFIDADGGFLNVLQQFRLHSKANSMVTASAFGDPLSEEGVPSTDLCQGVLPV
ncbi:hypothetical protein EPR50_G00113840 [Perca flavescens]|uniref:non-specific serine/threonine protein kinase n=1 Tax=Perca flavescens TaxID=8167 RepID=A0A484CSD5_PERFV|nr:hypothetical protein EPR50_G00113840 [Perca flavescens]